MLSEIVRAILEKILRDKLIMGLIIMMIVAVFVTGGQKDPNGARLFSKKYGAGQEAELPEEGGEQPGNANKMQNQAGGQNQMAGQNIQNGQSQQNGPNQQNNLQNVQARPQVTPADAQVATEFIRWWLSKGMDYQQTTADASHKEALSWIKPPATDIFVKFFWPAELAANIRSGRQVGNFQIATVTPLAINPDGSVPLRVTGVLVLQDTGYAPRSQPLELNFLVKKEAEGLRIINFYQQAGMISTSGQ
ncbi:MAG: hypothetical protein K2Y32_00525 [Candidatus Obscuribacterales bacterium]|nr:hypothetical protein [Candidatus Obscuribacterales bacterium]